MAKYEYRPFKSSYFHFQSDLNELLNDGWEICSEFKILECIIYISDKEKKPCYFTTLKRLIKNK